MSILKCIAAVCAAILSLTASAAKTPPTRLDVSSQPDGATVVVDGKTRGVTPLSVFDLSSGTHLVHVECEGWRAADEFVSLVEGDFVQKNFALQRDLGVLLLRTTPPGAEVKCEGVTLGQTPLLVTTLSAGEQHVLDLSMNGYRAAKVSVTLGGRIPVVRDEMLALDSGTLVCSSSPAGATVLVNGVERGTTPCTVENVPKGNAIVMLKLAGYADEVRELYFTPGDRQTLHRELRAKDARLTVVTFPEGGMVYVDGDYQGKAPVTVETLKPGTRKLTVKMHGHAPMERTVDVPNGAEMTEEFRLDAVLGRIEVFTLPSARVSLDGKTIGSTASKFGAVAKADAFPIEKVDAGEHQLLVHLDGYQDVSRKVSVKAKETSVVKVRLAKVFAPDVEVETVHRVYRGMLISRGAEGVTIEISPGVEQTFPNADVRRVQPIERR